MAEQTVRQIQKTCNRKAETRSGQHGIYMEELQNTEEQQKTCNRHTRSTPFPALPGFFFHLTHPLYRYVLLVNLPLHLLFCLQQAFLTPAAFLLKNGNLCLEFFLLFFQSCQRFFLFLLQALFLLLQQIERCRHIKLSIAASLVICHIVPQLIRKALFRSSFQLTDRGRIIINGLADTAEQHAKIAVLHRKHLAVCQAHQFCIRVLPSKIPCQTESFAAAFKHHFPRIVCRVFPWLITAVHIIFRRPSPAARHAEQHAADEGVHRRLSTLVFPADQLNPVGKFQCTVLHFSKIADFQFFYFHFLSLPQFFSTVPACRQQCLESIVERFLRLRVRLCFKHFNVCTDETRTIRFL